MTVRDFSLQDNKKKVWFFEKTFLLADISVKVVLEMLFPSLSIGNLKFDTKKLTWRLYIIAEALLTAKRVKLIYKHEFLKQY